MLRKWGKTNENGVAVMRPVPLLWHGMSVKNGGSQIHWPLEHCDMSVSVARFANDECFRTDNSRQAPMPTQANTHPILTYLQSLVTRTEL